MESVFRMSIFYKAALAWYAFRAYLEAIHHVLRGHNVRWHISADELNGDELRCDRCPDIEDDIDGRGMLIWVRGRKSSEAYFQGE
jgi:hypothetical protein